MKKTALITGASGGIGSAAAVALADEGFRIALCCNSNEKAVRSLASKLNRVTDTVVCKVDVSDRDEVSAAFETVSLGVILADNHVVRATQYTAALAVFKQQLLTRRINLYNIYDLNLSLFTKNCTDVLETSLFKSQKMRLYITVSVEYSCFLLYNINVMTTLRSQRVKRDRYGKNCLQKGR